MDWEGLPMSRDIIHHRLQGCIKNKDIAAGRQIYSHMVSFGLDSISVLVDHLVSLVASCGQLQEAHGVFCRHPERGVFTWFAMISAHVNLCKYDEALKLYHKMERKGIKPNKFIYLCILKSCSSLKALGDGRIIYQEIIKSGLASDVVVGNSIVDMYIKCRSLGEARETFDKLPNRNVVSWSIMIAGYTQNGCGLMALKLFDNMQQERIVLNEVISLFILKACATIQAVEKGRLIHDEIVTAGFEVSTVMGNILVDMYAKCGSLKEACKVFVNLQNRDIVSWGTMIAGYVQHGQGLRALECFDKLLDEGLKPSNVIFSCILKACGCLDGVVDEGRLIYSQVIKNGLESDVVIGNTLVDMYAKWDSIEEAQHVFNELFNKDVVSWGAMISVYARDGQSLIALDLFGKMQQQGIKPNKVIFLIGLRSCGSVGAINQGRQIHDQIVKSKFQSDVTVGSTLLDMYAKCGSLEEARRVFDNLSKQDVVSWGAMIAGYALHGHCRMAFQLLEEMQVQGIMPDKVLFLCILKSLSSSEEKEEGRFLHQQIIQCGFESDTDIGNGLIDMYGKCGDVDEATNVFKSLPNQDILSWSAITAVYVQHGFALPTLKLFHRLQQEGFVPDKVLFLWNLKACSNIGAALHGMSIHDQIIRSGFESDVLVGSTLIVMYAKCGGLDEACKVFNNLQNRNVVSWSVMISGYAQHGLSFSCLECFEKMQQEGIEPSEAIFLCSLKACGKVGEINHGRMIHKQILMSGFQSNVVFGSTLVDMYAKCGNLEDACSVFDELPTQTGASWGAMILGYAQHGASYCALRLFDEMQQEGFEPDKVTFLCVLKACGSVGSLRQGMLIHDQIMRNDIVVDLLVGNIIIDMYARCGSMDDAQMVFDGLQSHDVVSWSAMITGYSQRGDCAQVMLCLDDMQHEGSKPDDVIFTSVLAACTHIGLLEEGLFYFRSMSEDHGITPSIEHYNCIIDLLGRAGCLDEAEYLLQSMPILPNMVGWRSLLTCCRTYNDMELGRRCLYEINQLDPNDASVHVLMSNIYAEAHMQEGAEKIRELRKISGLQKKLGKAWIEVNNEAHEFTVGHKGHPNVESICLKFENSRTLMKREGYVPQVDLVLEAMFKEDNGMTCVYSE